MAQITRCDGGCGRESPERGSHIANTWIKMTSAVANQSHVTGCQTERIFCDKCWQRVEIAMHRPETEMMAGGKGFKPATSNG